MNISGTFGAKACALIAREFISSSSTIKLLFNDYSHVLVRLLTCTRTIIHMYSYDYSHNPRTITHLYSYDYSHVLIRLLAFTRTITHMISYDY